MVDGMAVDEGIGQGVVVKKRGSMEQPDLGGANPLRRNGVDSPVEAENAGCVVGLEALGLRRGCQHAHVGRGTGKVDQQRDCSPLRTEDGPVRGAGTLQAGVDDIFRVMSFIGLRNQAITAIELSGE